MRIFTFAVLLLFLLCSCASKQSSKEAKAELDARYSPKIGFAKKQELVEEFGNPEWCRVGDDGMETCRFYMKKGRVWKGENKRDKKHYEAFDQVMAEFDDAGVLQKYESSAQR